MVGRNRTCEVALALWSITDINRSEKRDQISEPQCGILASGTGTTIQLFSCLFKCSPPKQPTKCYTFFSFFGIGGDSLTFCARPHLHRCPFILAGFHVLG